MFSEVTAESNGAHVVVQMPIPIFPGPMLNVESHDFREKTAQESRSAQVAPAAGSQAPPLLGRVAGSSLWAKKLPELKADVDEKEQAQRSVTTKLDILINSIFRRLLCLVVSAAVLALALGGILGVMLIVKAGKPISLLGPVCCLTGLGIFSYCCSIIFLLKKIRQMFETKLGVPLATAGPKGMGTRWGVIFDPAKNKIKHFLQKTLLGIPALFLCFGISLLLWGSSAPVALQELSTVSGSIVASLGAIVFCIDLFVYCRLLRTLYRARDISRHCILHDAAESESVVEGVGELVDGSTRP
eukprot:gnl/TRDRNA2_/TRDRNA2_180300_c0_seq1.p1 gnl/TRDRNA2_/TRDRNA2_180300_c0~~gnl/TRDRNA2_/TRDRNA2_180300_c0_seq1.p1  ORF type:complete len:317 (-),score=34.13 gnl/TRDRNA2_/TRDRNA2_180300_c0_seq1:335-1234(-)